jgi:hypothetical protein
MIQNFTIIGNCQARTLSEFLLSNNDFCEKYHYIKLNDIFRMNEEELNDLYINILQILDLIIIQPISENYRNNYRYSTKSILNNVNINCKKIMFPSLYFDYYHPYTCYVYDKNNPSWKLGNPFDYHDENIIYLYIDYMDNVDNINNDDLKNFLLNEYKKKICDQNILDDDYFINKLNININNLIDRENTYINYCTKDTKIIKSSKYILENYKKNLLFYSINHPTKYLFYYISDKILSILNISLLNYPDDIDPLKALIIPLYKCIQKYVDFNINCYLNYRHYDIILYDTDIIQQYIDAYNQIDINILKENIFN